MNLTKGTTQLFNEENRIKMVGLLTILVGILTPWKVVNHELLSDVPPTINIVPSSNVTTSFTDGVFIDEILNPPL